jgi:xylulokinase
VKALSLVGGGSRSPCWAQLIADVLGVTLETHVGGEAGAALGAARLAQLACGAGEAEVCTRPPVARAFTPGAAGGALLAERLERFRRLYAAVAPLWQRRR